MGGSVVDHCLINGVGGLVRENAGGQAGDQLLDAQVLAAYEDVVLHHDIVPPEVHFVGLRLGAARNRRPI